MRRSALVKLGFAAFLAAAPLLAACTSGPDGAEEAELTGRASMSLVTQANGRVYRLSDAIFSIEGPIFTYLSSSDDPSETARTAALPVGVELCSMGSLGSPCERGGVCTDIGYTEFGICF